MHFYAAPAAWDAYLCSSGSLGGTIYSPQLHIYAAPAAWQPQSMHMYAAPAVWQAQSMHIYAAPVVWQAQSMHIYTAPAAWQAQSMHIYAASAVWQLPRGPPKCLCSHLCPKVLKFDVLSILFKEVLEGFQNSIFKGGWGGQGSGLDLDPPACKKPV